MFADIIARLEKAAGHDRALNADIAFAIGLYARPPVVATPPDYTASIDAALTLVPEDWVWTLYGPGGITCARVDLVRVSAEFEETEIIVTSAPTTELCVCIAAFKARS